MPRVSIILAVFNGEKYLHKSVDSILNQTLRDLELIIVNDGSSDGTAGLADALARQDSRVRVFHLPPSGRPSFPRNYALDRAIGDYVGFVDHDDWCDLDRLKQMVEGLDSHPDWVAAFYDVKVTDGDGIEKLGTWFHNHENFVENAKLLRNLDKGWYECGPDFYRLMCRNVLPLSIQSAMVARHRIKFDQFRFDTEFAIVDDADMWMRLIPMGKFGYFDRALAYYRNNPQGITKRTEVFFRDIVKLHAKNYLRAEKHLGADELLKYRRLIADQHGTFAWYLETQGKYAEARDQYLAAYSRDSSARWIVRWIKTLTPIAKLRTRLRSAVA